MTVVTARERPPYACQRIPSLRQRGWWVDRRFPKTQVALLRITHDVRGEPERQVPRTSGERIGGERSRTIENALRVHQKLRLIAGVRQDSLRCRRAGERRSAHRYHRIEIGIDTGGLELAAHLRRASQDLLRRQITGPPAGGKKNCADQSECGQPVHDWRGVYYRAASASMSPCSWMISRTVFLLLARTSPSSCTSRTSLRLSTSGGCSSTRMRSPWSVRTVGESRVCPLVSRNRFCRSASRAEPSLTKVIAINRRSSPFAVSRRRARVRAAP